MLASISNHSVPPKRREEAGTGRSLESHKAASTGYTTCNEEVMCLQQGGQQWGSVLEAALSWNICAHDMRIHAQKLREKNKNAASAEIMENIERECYKKNCLNTVRNLENNRYKII